MTAQKKKGGARPGAGRKKRQAPVEVIDGRTVTGKENAQNLIDELNSIDPEIMEHRELLVSAEPIEILDDVTKEQLKDLEKREARRKIVLAFKDAAETKFRTLSYEVQGWALLWFGNRTALETRKYLTDRAKGKAVITVNHLHDKPLEVNMTVSLAEAIQKARKRAAEKHKNA